MANRKFQDQSHRLSSSCPDGLNEEHSFIPYASPTVRKTSSMDDISRFYRYYQLLESNSGKLLTWRHYLKILQDQLCSFETMTIVSKLMLKKLPAPTGCVTPQTASLKTNHHKFESDCEKVAIGDTYSIASSFDENASDISDSSAISINTRARILRTICTETRILAEKICKTVEMITLLPKKCASCGGTIKGLKHLNQCVHSSERIGDTFNMLERKSLKRVDKIKATTCSKGSSYLPMRSPSVVGESSSRPRFRKFIPLKKSSMKRLAHMCSHFVRQG